nr:MAG TPA: hypothetical protein [Caudoviricetes sp.]
MTNRELLERLKELEKKHSNLLDEEVKINFTNIDKDASLDDAEYKMFSDVFSDGQKYLIDNERFELEITIKNLH